MIRLPIALFAIVCVVALSTSDVQAQYLHGPAYYGQGQGGYSPNGYQNDPRLGYCLTNDCSGQGGYGGGYRPGYQGGGCYGGGGYGGGGCCGGGYGGGQPIVVHVRVNGRPATPIVQSYYPSIPGGQGYYRGGYYGNNQPAANQRFVGTRNATKNQARPTQTRTTAGGYRYKF